MIGSFLSADGEGLVLTNIIHIGLQELRTRQGPDLTLPAGITPQQLWSSELSISRLRQLRVITVSLSVSRSLALDHRAIKSGAGTANATRGRKECSLIRNKIVLKNNDNNDCPPKKERERKKGEEGRRGQRENQKIQIQIIRAKQVGQNVW